MLTKRVFSLSKSLRSLVVPTQYNIIYHCQRNEHFKANQSLNQGININDTSNEINFDSTPTDFDGSDFLEIDNKNTSGSSIIAELKSILHLHSKNTSKLKSLQDPTSFKDLCTTIEKNIKKLSLSEVLEILKILVTLKIPSDSKLISSLLQNVESNLSTSNIKNYSTLSNILSKIESTPLTQTISKNLNKKFVIHLNSNFKENDIDFLIHALHYACHNLPSKQIVHVVLNALSSCNFSKVSTEQAFLILKTFHGMSQLPTICYQILHDVQIILINNIHEVKKRDVQYLLYICSNKILRNGKDYWYNSILLDKIAERIVKDELSFNDTLNCLSTYNKLNHVNKNLLSYLSAIFYEEYELSKSSKLYDFNKLLVLLNGLALMRYKPIFWDAMYKYYQNGEIFEYNAETQLIYCFNLATIGCYDSLVLEKVFQSDLTLYPTKTMWTCFRLWQILQMIPGYNGPQPPSKTLEDFQKLVIKPKDSSLQSSLEQIVKGPEYFKTNLKSKLFHLLDVVLIYKKSKDPTPQVIDQDVEYLEDLNVPNDCQIVVIVVQPHSLFARNTEQLMGSFDACYDYLRSQSCEIIFISYDKWKNMQEKTRIAYLENEIKSHLKESKTFE